MNQRIDESRFADPVDYATYGQYGPGRGFKAGRGFNRPRYPFQGRITADGSSGLLAEPGRYHLYISWVCPWAQRTAIVRQLKGLQDVISLSCVDDDRDGRGWAFRERRGADPVNGFRFLSEAYEATEPGYEGHTSVPVLWDRTTGRIASNNFPDITLDMNSAFQEWANDLDLYPEPLRAEIDALNQKIYETVNNGPYRVAGSPAKEQYDELRQRFLDTFEELDKRLADQRLLFGDTITESDVRLWVTLARYDLGYNPLAGISERRLTDFPNLWAYARDLYQRPAFRLTSDFDAFTHLSREPKPAFLYRADWRLQVSPYQADWDEPHGRDRLGKS